MKTIKQIAKDQIMNFLLNDKAVYRLNIENDSLADLTTKSIQTINRDAEKDCYLYFTLEDCEPALGEVDTVIERLERESEKAVQNARTNRKVGDNYWTYYYDGMGRAFDMTIDILRGEKE